MEQKKFHDLPEFSDEVLEQIKAEHIKACGDKAKELWESGRMNLDYIKEDYNAKRAASSKYHRLLEGKEVKEEKPETPLSDELSKKVSKLIDETGKDPVECHNEVSADYDNAHNAVMRFCVAFNKKFRVQEN